MTEYEPVLQELPRTEYHQPRRTQCALDSCAKIIPQDDCYLGFDGETYCTRNCAVVAHLDRAAEWD
jgi:hypothetical protein